MPYANANGVKLYYEEAGKGTPIVFVHEFSGDFRSWEAQMRHFSRSYRCITYSARGYLPSDVPEGVESYPQEHWREDLRAVGRRVKARRFLRSRPASGAGLCPSLRSPRRWVCHTNDGVVRVRREASGAGQEDSIRA